MNASETIAHFTDMGVLDKVIYSNSGNALIIMAACSHRGYALRCMKDFESEKNQYYSGMFGIDAVTDDNVPVRLLYSEDDDDPYENTRGADV